MLSDGPVGPSVGLGAPRWPCVASGGPYAPLLACWRVLDRLSTRSPRLPSTRSPARFEEVLSHLEEVPDCLEEVLGHLDQVPSFLKEGPGRLDFGPLDQVPIVDARWLWGVVSGGRTATAPPAALSRA
jgi:hypothetical protein